VEAYVGRTESNA